MAISRTKKEEIVKDIHERADRSKVLVFVNFHGVSVDKMAVLRSNLRDVNSQLKVAKKRLIKRVLEGLGVKGDMPQFEGELAIAFGTDEVSAPQVLNKFAKDKNIKILGGVLEGEYLGAEVVNQLASIPSQDVLMGQVVGSIASPLRGMVGVLQGPARDFISVIDKIRNSNIEIRNNT